MTLEEMKPGSSGKIVTISGDARSRRRIVDMGVTPGTQVAVERVAPLGSVQRQHRHAVRAVSEHESHAPSCPGATGPRV